MPMVTGCELHWWHSVKRTPSSVSMTKRGCALSGWPGTHATAELSAGALHLTVNSSGPESRMVGSRGFDGAPHAARKQDSFFLDLMDCAFCIAGCENLEVWFVWGNTGRGEKRCGGDGKDPADSLRSTGTVAGFHHRRHRTPFIPFPSQATLQKAAYAVPCMVQALCSLLFLPLHLPSLLAPRRP